MEGPKLDLNNLGTKVWTGFGQVGFCEHDFQLPSSIKWEGEQLSGGPLRQ
jgi:hypothetical protein